MTYKYYTPVNNKLLEYLMTVNKASQLKIILCIVRFTAGFHRDEAVLSTSFIEKYTGISRRCIQKELKELEKDNIIVRKIHKENNIKVLSLHPSVGSEQTDMGDERESKESHEPEFTPHAEPPFIPPSAPADTQEINIYKNNILNKESKETHTTRYSPVLLNSVNDWSDIHNLNSKSKQALFRIIDRYLKDYSEDEVAETINQCIAEGRGSIYFDRLQKIKRSGGWDLEAFTWREAGM